MQPPQLIFQTLNLRLLLTDDLQQPAHQGRLLALSDFRQGQGERTVRHDRYGSLFQTDVIDLPAVNEQLLTGLAQELVRFDLQQMDHLEISGVAYQQGTLAGYETREYLLNKWGRECAYCGAKNNPLQVEHIHPKAQGGSDRVSNLTLACQPCNQQKGTQDLHVLHALDAACVGLIDARIDWEKPTLAIKATGRGSYQRTRLNAYGFPRGYLTRQKRIKGCQTGDLIKAEVTKGKKIGAYMGRVAVRASGSFNLQTAHGVIQGIGHRYCQVLQRADGYGYSQLGTPEKAAELRSARYPSPA